MERKLVAIVLVIAGFLLLSNFFPLQFSKTQIIFLNVSPNRTIEKRFAQIYLPAVSSEGKGVVTTLTVEALPGDGKVLVNINQLLFWIDTQQSIQIAKKVAQDYTKLDLSKYDLIYSIETNASLVEGPSAGAAITIATIAALENKTLNKSVMITGTINPDGTIGPVGGITAKAAAAKDIGAKLFLVPEGQGTYINYLPVKKCQQVGPLTYCVIEYKPQKVDISREVGIQVKEVSRIEDALKYFF